MDIYISRNDRSLPEGPYNFRGTLQPTERGVFARRDIDKQAHRHLQQARKDLMDDLWYKAQIRKWEEKIWNMMRRLSRIDSNFEMCAWEDVWEAAESDSSNAMMDVDAVMQDDDADDLPLEEGEILETEKQNRFYARDKKVGVHDLVIGVDLRNAESDDAARIGGVCGKEKSQQKQRQNLLAILIDNEVHNDGDKSDTDYWRNGIRD